MCACAYVPVFRQNTNSFDLFSLHLPKSGSMGGDGLNVTLSKDLGGGGRGFAHSIDRQRLCLMFFYLYILLSLICIGSFRNRKNNKLERSKINIY